MNDYAWMEQSTLPKRLPKREQRPVELIRAERKLPPAMRMYLRFVLESVTLAEAARKMHDAGFHFERTTLHRWRRRPDFIKAQELGNEYILKVVGINKARTLLDSEKVKQLALTPQPILYKGKRTGEVEVDLGAAMRAIEFQGKAVGIGNEEQRRVQVAIDIDFSGRDEKPTIEGEVLGD